jgi:hypothetical protein
VQLEQGDLARARRSLEDALRLDRAVGSAYEGLAHAALAACHAARDDVDAAEQELRAAAEKRADPAVLELQQGHVELARARHAAAHGRGDEAARLVAAARRRAAALAGRSTDLRLAQRLLARALAGLASPDADAAPALTVGTAGRWFQTRGGERVELARRAALCRVLARLVEERAAAPGATLSVDALFEAGWPGERVQPDAAARRVYTAIWTLRKAGLKDLILQRESGYLLDPGAPVAEGR